MEAKIKILVAVLGIVMSFACFSTGCDNKVDNSELKQVKATFTNKWLGTKDHLPYTVQLDFTEGCVITLLPNQTIPMYVCNDKPIILQKYELCYITEDHRTHYVDEYQVYKENIIVNPELFLQFVWPLSFHHPFQENK